MKNELKDVGDLKAPLCLDCGHELDFVDFHLVCTKCHTIYNFVKRSGLDVFLGNGE